MKKAGTALASAGAFILVLTVLWMTVGTSMFIKIPKGQEEFAFYTGEFVYYVDPLTYKPLPDGGELRLAAEIERHVFTLDDQFSGDLSPMQEEISAKAGIISKELTSVYVLDRSDSVNVADPRAWSWYPDNVQDRSGAYYPIFPMGMVEGETYPSWKAEIGGVIEARFIEKGKVEGIDVYMMEGAMDRQPLVDEYVAVRGFPASTTFAQLSAELKAQGVDLEAMVAAAVPALSPEDQQALALALEQPVPLRYYMTSSKLIAVEPAAGYPMAIYDAREEVGMLPDYASLSPVLDLIAGSGGGGLKEQLASAEPRTVYTQAYSQTEDSIKESADYARKNMNLIKTGKVIVPVAGFALGGLLLAGGIVLVLAGRKRAA